MVLCSEDNAMFPARYNQLQSMNSFGYSPQHQEQYTGQMGNSDGYNHFSVTFSDPNIQQLAHSASWAGVYAARTGHGSVPQGTSNLLEDWSSPAPHPYCTSSESSPSPNAYTYSMPYRSSISPNAPTIDYNIPSPETSPTSVVHGTGVSVIATHQSNPCTIDEKQCQGSPSGSRPLRPPYDWMKRQTYQTVPSAGKTRTKDKYRVVYSDHQRLELEKEFHYSRYITIRRKAELAQSLGLSERQVKIWFQNRRAKERKQKKKEDALAGIKGLPEVTMQSQALARVQPNHIHHKPQPTLPTEINQSQTPHLTHGRVQAQETMRQEEVPNNSSIEALQP